MSRQHIPNIISILRILLVAPIVYFLWQQNYLVALILFLIGGLSDGLDGFLARRYHWQTELGVLLDPMGDKLMMLGAYLLLGWQQLLPWWLVGLVIARDMILVTGTMLYRRLIGAASFTPLFVSKLNTVLQILLVLGTLLDQVVTWGGEGVLEILIVMVTFTTVWSGYAYAREWGQRAWQAWHQQQEKNG